LGTGYYIDWTGFEELVMDFVIGEYTYNSNEDPRLIPQIDVIKYIQKQYSCCYPSAWSKLQTLIRLNKELKKVKRSHKRKGPFDKIRHPCYVKYMGNKMHKWRK